MEWEISPAKNGGFFLLPAGGIQVKKGGKEKKKEK